MADLSGNPYASAGANTEVGEDVIRATLTIAWELRTANLIALRGPGAADDPDIKQRLGIADDPTTSPY